MKYSNRITILCITLLFFSALTLRSQTPIAPQNLEIGVVEQLNEYVPENIKLINEKGEEVILDRLLDKPTILNLVYYRCPGICSPLMEGVASVLDRMDMQSGKDFQVLTISFDPREYIDLAKRKKNNYLNLMNNPEKAAGWHFFVSDSASIARLTGAVGFRYKKTGNDFLHSASLIVLSPNGKITRYLNGVTFLPFEVKIALIEASEGKSGPTVNKILQYCYSYDPVGQEYALNITRVAGTLIIAIALTIFLVLVLKQTTTNMLPAVTGAFILGFSSILTGLNFIVTIHRMRAPGMRWMKMPLFPWALYGTAWIQVLATPIVGITLLMIIMERTLSIGFFDPALGGDPILYQHLF